MSDAIEPSLPRKLWMTPWRDLLCGRLTLRLDVARQIHAAEIPEKAKTVISTVVRRTRLWRSEKVAVAEELIAHFADGLETGEPVEKLVEKFGDVKRAAKLIRRAKIRNRPILWRATRVAIRIVEAMIAVHLLLAAYFFAGRPSPNVDYLAQLNQPILLTPEDQRAWPIYRQAILKIADYKPPDELVEGPDPYDELVPGRKGWPWMTAWLRGHTEALNLMREAGAKPVLGFVFGVHGSADDRKLFPGVNLSDYEKEPPMYYPRPYLLQGIPIFLRKDDELAMQDRDSGRFMSDIAAMLGIAGQFHQVEMSNTGLSVRIEAIHEINIAITRQPNLLNDMELQTLAHEIANFGDPAELSDLQQDKLRFYDVIQRNYTDDGNGNGRLTPEGTPRMWEPFVVTTRAEMFMLGPWIMALTASRSQTVDLYERWAQLADADLHKPLRESPVTAADKLREAKSGNYWEYHRYLTFDHSNVTLYWPRRNAEVLLGERDGAEVGLALEVFHRHHGQYPQSLHELVPALLPEIPIDRITGDPVKYRVINGKPIVYSVGVDHKDDGGRPPIVHGESENLAAARWPEPGQAGKPVSDGDWVLYPLPKEDN
jgi:hypothetical protein